MIRFFLSFAALAFLCPPRALLAGGPPASTGFLPERALIPPLLAHVQEARVGVRKEAGTSRLTLGIGATMDLFAAQLGDDGSAVAGGIDFFTTGLTTSNEGFRLQVDAVDGFFGGHLSLSLPRAGVHYQLRLRLLHQSAHFVDGHYDLNAQGWRDGRAPLPFTRDFGELTALLRTGTAAGGMRLYTGLSYATLVRPAPIRRVATLHGVELFTGSVLPDLGGRQTTLYAAAHLGLSGVPAWSGTVSIEAGVKFGEIDGRGVRLYGGFLSGPGVFGQYYDLRRTSWGIGFAFDPW